MLIVYLRLIGSSTSGCLCINRGAGTDATRLGYGNGVGLRNWRADIVSEHVTFCVGMAWHRTMGTTAAKLAQLKLQRTFNHTSRLTLLSTAPLLSPLQSLPLPTVGRRLCSTRKHSRARILHECAHAPACTPAWMCATTSASLIIAVTLFRAYTYSI